MMIIYLILVLTVIASGSLIFFFKSGDQRLMKFLLAFSGAFLIGITFLILIPEVYREATVFTGLFVLLGFVLQLFLELITEGAEHGHKHTHSDDERVSPFLLLIGLCIHAFLEGMPLVKNLGDGLTRSLVSGIVVHNIPISLTLMGLFLHYGLSMRKAFVFLFVFFEEVIFLLD